jgi:uncharacterized protein YaiE (UPF0345 family)
MSQFDNVSIAKQANIYFDGLVTSRTVNFADGSRVTLGIMQKGDYEFDTDCKELMDIQSGELDVQLPGEDWKPVRGGESFEVPANASFKLKVHSVVDYCCSYF